MKVAMWHEASTAKRMIRTRMESWNDKFGQEIVYLKHGLLWSKLAMETTAAILSKQLD
jgi:hypothetical protein